MQLLRHSLSPLGVTTQNPAFHVTEFNQSFGPDLLVNGDFSSWSGDNPVGWNVTGESGSDPEISERAPGNAHGDAVGAGGAANFFSSVTTSQPRINQAVMTSGNCYSAKFEITRRVAGNFAILNIQNSLNNYSFITNGIAQQIGRATSTAFQPAAVGAAPHDFTVDNFSLRQVTYNTRIQGHANQILEYYFDLGVNSDGGVENHILYRIAEGAGNEVLNCFDVLLRRNYDLTDTYEFRSRMINGGSVSNFTTVQVAKPDALRIIVNGDDHQIYTRAQGTQTWTLRSSFTNSTFNTNTGVNILHGDGITPQQVIGWRL